MTTPTSRPRARAVAGLMAADTLATDLVQPGHIFPAGGGRRRADAPGPSEQAAIWPRWPAARPPPSSVSDERRRDDGTPARPAVVRVGTRPEDRHRPRTLIEHRSRTETLVERVASREIQNCSWLWFMLHAYKDKPSHAVHMALVRGQWTPDEAVAVRVHEPLSVLDALELERDRCTWA